MSSINKHLKDRNGQSLVAAALVAPILIFIIVGLVEVVQLAVTQNQVSTAARNAARYSANGGEDVGIRNMVMNTITQTLSLSSGVWDIWSIRAEVETDGTILTDTFDFTHIFGDGLTEDYAVTNSAAFEDDLRLRVQEELRKDGTATTVSDLGAGLDVSGVYLLHDVETILGLNLLPNITGFNTIKGYSVMRRASLASTVYTTGGCRGVFPIVLEENVRTITESDYDDLTFVHPLPAAKPAWQTFAIQPDSPTPLMAAEEGNIFKLDLGYGIEDFNWLKWNTGITGITPPPAGHSILATSLLWPGNSDDYADYGDPSVTPGVNAFRGFADAVDIDDVEMHIGDWVAEDNLDGFGGLSVAANLQDHINEDRALRLVLWDESAGGYSADGFQVSGFGVFRIKAYGSSWLLLEFVRHDTSCGQN
jgi:hypothetical protein